MPVNPLLLLAQNRKTAADAAKTAAEAALTAAKADVDNKKSAYNLKVSELAQIAQEINLIRKALPLVDSEADGVALSADLSAKIVESRVKQGEIVAAGRLLTKAKVASARAGIAATDARAEAANAASASAEAQTADTRRNGWKTSLAAAPLSTVGADATAALASAAFTAAGDRLEGDLTASLQSLSLARAGVESAVAALAKKKAVDAVTALNPRLSDVDRHTAALTRAEDAVTVFVKTAKPRLDEATALLAKVGDPAVDALSAAETASIQDAALQADRDTVAGLAEAVATAVKAAIDGGAEIEDTGADAAVIAATAAFDAPAQLMLEEWEATVPDGTWSLAADFQAARRALHELKTGSAALVTAMDNAETSLAAALTAASAAAATVAQLKATAQDTQSLYEGALAELPARTLSAVRGDA